LCSLKQGYIELFGAKNSDIAMAREGTFRGHPIFVLSSKKLNIFIYTKKIN
jgi:hypothetical protein